MAVKVVSGIDGSIVWASGHVQKVTEWTLNMLAEEVETTQLGDQWKQWLPGVKEWSGTYVARLEQDPGLTDTTVGATSHLGLGADTTAGADAEFKFGVSKFTGTIFITGIDANVAIGGESGTYTFTFRGTNELNWVDG